MFVVEQAETFTWPVTVNVPKDGKHEAHRFTAEFRFIDQDRINELVRASDEDLLKEVWVGWDQVNDQDGHPLPYTDAARDQLLKKPFIRMGVAAAFFEGITGIKRKN